MYEESWHHNLQGQQFSSFFHNIQTGPGAHPPSYSVRTADCCPEIKQPGNEAECLYLSSVEVKNGCSYTSTPTCLHSVYRTTLHLRSDGMGILCIYFFFNKSSSHSSGMELRCIIVCPECQISTFL